MWVINEILIIIFIIMRVFFKLLNLLKSNGLKKCNSFLNIIWTHLYHKINRLKFYYFYLKTNSQWARKETLFCWGPLKDFSYSTFLHFSILWNHFHSIFCFINLYPLTLVLFCTTFPKKKKKRLWYFLLYAFNFRCSHPLTLVLLFSVHKIK